MREEVLPLLKEENGKRELRLCATSLHPPMGAPAPILVNEFQVTLDCVVWDRSVNNIPMSRKDESDLAIMLKLHDYKREFSCGRLHSLPEARNH